MNIEEIRSFCLDMPDATEDVKWGSDLCFCIMEKMFCVVALNSDPLSISFKVTPTQFDDLIEREEFNPAKYVARYTWVSLPDASLISSEELKSLIIGSYELIGKKKK